MRALKEDREAAERALSRVERIKRQVSGERVEVEEVAEKVGVERDLPYDRCEDVARELPRLRNLRHRSLAGER